MENNLMLELKEDQIALIKTQIAPEATDEELKLFLYQSQRTGLDPLTRQIYCVHRKEGNKKKMTIQTSIDGFRVIAERSGSYAGQDEPDFGPDMEFKYPVTEWVNGQSVVREWKIMPVPLWCKVRVYKFKGEIRYLASVGVAYWSEYYPGHPGGNMWRKMPHNMISKVAEALALRKGYPQDLSGLYTGEEMDQDVKTEDITYQDVKTEDKQPVVVKGNEKPMLAEGSAHFSGAIAKLKAKKTTIEKIKSVYDISADVEQKLIDQSKA